MNFPAGYRNEVWLDHDVHRRLPTGSTAGSGGFEFWWPAVLLILMMLLWHDLWEMDKRLQSAGFC